jgi:hypothetical protein
MDRCNELCTKDTTGSCAVCEELAERARFERFWFKGGWFIAFFVSRRKNLLLGLGALLLVLGLYGICQYYWVIPNQHLASERISPSWKRELTQKEFYELQNNIRQTFLQALGLLGGLIGGAALLGGLYFTAQTLRASRETLRVNQETLQTTQQGQITERFTKAIEQLGDKERLMVRLGGIYALGGIARDPKSDQWAVMEVLTAFVREQVPATTLLPDNTSGEKETKESLPIRKPRFDIQAILTVIGQPPGTFGNGEIQRLNLNSTNLQGANLLGAQLQGANLRGAQLQGAQLGGAQLLSAQLESAQLQDAYLIGAQLQNAYLIGAQFQNAYLIGAQLQGANLTEVVSLTQDQLNTAYIDENTKLPEGLTRPASYPTNP